MVRFQTRWIKLSLIREGESLARASAKRVGTFSRLERTTTSPSQAYLLPTDSLQTKLLFLGLFTRDN